MNRVAPDAGHPAAPAPDCSICPRLAAFRARNRLAFPDFFNAPVPSFGPLGARLLVVGLAPGLRGANRTGRPFTGDHAGHLLYGTLQDFGLASGTYQGQADDGFRLIDCRITNAVRCVPPDNKPIGREVAACRQFLAVELAAMPRLTAIVTLGVVAHGAVVAALSLRQRDYPFAHGAVHPLPGNRVLADSFHCSRYNTSTGRLTPTMFAAVFATVRRRLDAVA